MSKEGIFMWSDEFDCGGFYPKMSKEEGFFIWSDEFDYGVSISCTEAIFGIYKPRCAQKSWKLDFPVAQRHEKSSSRASGTIKNLTNFNHKTADPNQRSNHTRANWKSDGHVTHPLILSRRVFQFCI
ncbi:hypothetical protein FRX31_004556 [Thalictrum thalictroides]|uniref:Uncharacterized protein n=1 Tax=Thalictrum thalictroides TaxID=46969 RepID=A0A7J6XA45_THATH|nr:hypothetical protein FRX31_004556 [Thalictrum thalictroides]